MPPAARRSAVAHARALFGLSERRENRYRTALSRASAANSETNVSTRRSLPHCPMPGRCWQISATITIMFDPIPALAVPRQSKPQQNHVRNMDRGVPQPMLPCPLISGINNRWIPPLSGNNQGNRSLYKPRGLCQAIYRANRSRKTRIYMLNRR